VVPDASLDQRFHDNPLVTGEPRLRFYAGCPVSGPGGHKVGTFCIADLVARGLEGDQLEMLRQFAALAEHELNMVGLIETQQELLETKNKLVETQAELAEELSEAAAYVRSVLPNKLSGPIRTDWQFVSSSQLGGDLFGYHWLDDTHLALYVMDVCGHGFSASLLSISIFNSLRRQTLPVREFRDPACVLTGLNGAYPMKDHGRKFATVWYGVYETTTRALRFAGAGHPPALRYEAGADAPISLGERSLPIGALSDTSYEADTRTLGPESRLYLFSDGVYELEMHDGRMLTLEGFIDLLSRCRRARGGSCPGCVLQRARSIARQRRGLPADRPRRAMGMVRRSFLRR
jgi:sigma-B regulation protein RsbU (phosphoserine phosphatase)